MDSVQRQRFNQLEDLCKNILDNMGDPIRADVIEDIAFHVEGDEDKTNLYLEMTGDFVKSILEYLVITDEEALDYNKLTFRMYPHVADELLDQMAQARHPFD